MCRLQQSPSILHLFFSNFHANGSAPLRTLTGLSWFGTNIGQSKLLTDQTTKTHPTKKARDWRTF